MKLGKETDHCSVLAVVFGGAGLVLWVVPMVSIFVNLAAIHYGGKGRGSGLDALGQVGWSLGVVGFVLTLLRTVYVFAQVLQVGA
ncbi:hypothetical protein [Anaerotalea alkaliphila]|uniref:DUF4190 domain-containing protein n=1 Tax=Anaerotalea alkaliphila TaxID=2662126 RepID=A0A7X5HWK6_9FIRM|nr:hypothetical protein [Anaerotalea alkaliphila]NDL67985.1 hypothetical protein [Anaerotalea alkaliphila]